MESDTEDTQSEGQVEEVSLSGGAVIEMQEFSNTEVLYLEVLVDPQKKKVHPNS